MKNFLVLILLVSVTACTTVSPTGADDPQQAWLERKNELGAIEQWTLSGRMSINNGVEHWSITMQWKQQGDKYEIDMFGPFGAGHVRLFGNKHGVMLQDSDNASYYSDEAETLLYETTGINMPITGIRYWIVGLPSPQAQESKLDNQGRLSFLDDNQWQVKFRRYVPVNGMTLPDKIFIEHPGKEIDVRLVVDDWKLGAF